MKTLFLLFLTLSLPLKAHEGHGEALSDPAKYGGVLASVVDEAKVGKGKVHNPAIFKAELVRTEDNTIRIYLYDLKANHLALGGFSPKASGTVENPKAKTKEKFELKLNGDHYLGKMPRQKKKPFNLYVSFSKEGKSLFVGYDHLD